ncbi:MAG: tetratricopeptide repeat protein [Bacteroidota bacterium]|nr:tetratricopeptide repeat protein [Bacteroidota bacterium]
MTRLTLAAIPGILLVVIFGCAPVAELEEENALLRRKVDSVEVERESCHARLTALSQRTAALEQEKTALEENVRRLSARLAEAATLPVAAVTPVTSPPTAEAAAERRSAKTVETRPEGKTPEREPSTAPQGREQAQNERQALDKHPTESETEPEIRRDVSPPSKSESVSLVVSSNPADERYLSRYQEALSHFNNRRYTRALPMFEALADTDPPNDMNDNALYWKGECLYALGRHAEAVTAFSTVIGMKGTDKKEAALMMRGNSYLKLGRKEDAKRDFRRLVELFPNGEFRSSAQRMLRKLR